MTKEEFKDLGTGSLVKHKGTGKVCIVADVIWGHGEIESYIGVTVTRITNPMEWDKVGGWEK